MSMEFSDVLASIETGPDHATRRVSVPADWLQGRTVFGGMQAALAVTAMRAAMSPDARALPLRSAQVTFIGPVHGEQPLGLRAETLRAGRSTVHARCDILLDGAVACSVLGIFGTPRHSQFVREMPAPDTGCLPDELRDVHAAVRPAPAFLEHFEIRYARGALPYTGYSEPRSMIYARLRDKHCGAENALIALADSIPTPVLSMLQHPAPASSLSWMIEILRDPQALDLHGWALIDTEVRAGTDGYLSQTSVLYGPDGHAYSVSHQTVGVFG